MCLIERTKKDFFSVPRAIRGGVQRAVDSTSRKKLSKNVCVIARRRKRNNNKKDSKTGIAEIKCCWALSLSRLGPFQENRGNAFAQMWTPISSNVSRSVNRRLQIYVSDFASLVFSKFVFRTFVLLLLRRWMQDQSLHRIDLIWSFWDIKKTSFVCISIRFSIEKLDFVIDPD